MKKVSEFLKSLNWCLKSISNAANIMAGLLSKSGQHYIITTNMEIIGIAVRNPEVYEICEKAALHVPDGIGAVKLLRKFGLKTQERVTGVDLGPALLKILPEGTKVYLFGASRGVAKSAMENLKKQLTQIDFVGSEHGYDISHEQLIGSINKSEAQILLVALGVPKQERWIYKNLPLMPKVKIAIGVGGSFDCWANPNRRTPVWIQNLGLEWAHRVLREPFIRVPRFMKTLRNFLPLYFFGK